MAKRIIWSVDALNDKVLIFSYWNNRNKSNLYSRKLNKLFKDTIKSILKTPSLGRKTDEPGVKSIIAKDYLLLYEEGIETIKILRVWDSRQDPNKLTSILK